MSDLTTAQIFQDGEKGITATKLNNIVANSVIQPGFYTGKPASPTLDPTDLLLELKGTNTYANITGSQLVSSVATQVTQVPGFIGGVASQVTLVNGFISKSAAYTLTTGDNNKYVICSGGSWTLTLPAPVLGLYFQLRNDQTCFGVTGTITLQPPVGGATIDGKTSLALLPCQECSLVCDGTNWRSFGLKRNLILGTQDITSSTPSAVVLLPVGFRYFELVWNSIQPITAGDALYARFSLDGGSTWLTAANYTTGTLYPSAATTPAYATAVSAFANLAGVLTTTGQLRLLLYPGSATRYASWISDSNGYAVFVSTYRQQGIYNAAIASPVNALQYYCSTSNILNSFLTVKGVV